jgi:hypothetical protein
MEAGLVQEEGDIHIVQRRPLCSWDEFDCKLVTKTGRGAGVLSASWLLRLVSSRRPLVGENDVREASAAEQPVNMVRGQVL